MQIMNKSYEADIVCIALHPQETQFCIGLVTGNVRAYSYKDDLTITDLWATRRHKKACRSIAYSLNGKDVITAGADKVIKRAQSNDGKVVQKIIGAHEDEINVVRWANDLIFCTGDDAGVIKAWSTESQTAQRIFNTHEDYVSDLVALEGKYILSTSGDGTLAIHDLRANRDVRLKRSDDQEDDLTCALLIKAHQKPKILAGGSEGVLSIFKRSDIGDSNDRILPPKKGKDDDVIGVECLAKIDENSVLVGGSDGIVRQLHVLPNEWKKEVMKFSDEPISSVQYSDNIVFASSGVELKLCLLKQAGNDECEDDSDAFSSDSDSPPPKKKSKSSKIETIKDKNDFFDDL